MAFERLHFDISFSDFGSTSRSHWHQKDKTEEKRVNFNSVVVFSLCLSKFCLIKFKLCAVLDVNEVCIVYTHKKSDYHFMIRIHAHEKDWEWETDQGRKKVSMSLMYNIILVWGTQKTSWHTSVYKNKHRYARYFFQVTICLHIFLQASCCLHWDCSKDTVLHCIFPILNVSSEHLWHKVGVVVFLVCLLAFHLNVSHLIISIFCFIQTSLLQGNASKHLSEMLSSF